MKVRGKRVSEWLGVEVNTTSHTEKLVAALGTMLAILSICLVSLATVEPGGRPLLVASMGASAVLLFAVPHGALSQPWALFCGHLVSALIGVSLLRWLPGTLLAPVLAVGLSVMAMVYLRCIHPPGGATALIPFVGGADVQAMGYGYVLSPILLSVALMLVIALLFNGLFSWRRYPTVLARPLREDVSPVSTLSPTREDIAAALADMNAFFDITPEDLEQVLAQAQHHARLRQGREQAHRIRP